jgi:hypothetical protein
MAWPWSGDVAQSTSVTGRPDLGGGQSA